MLSSRRLVVSASRQLPLCARAGGRWFSSEAASQLDVDAVLAEEKNVVAKPTAAANAASNGYKPYSGARSTVPKPTPPRVGKPLSSAVVTPPPVWDVSNIVHQGRRQSGSAEEGASLLDAAPTADVDWTQSFHGIATRPVTDEQFQVLMKPISATDVEVKPDGIIYLPEIKYRRRLNEAFGPMGWGLIPKGEPAVGQNIVTREYALIIDGRFVSQSQGENTFFSPEQLPSAVEGCKSNALVRCCKDLGVSSELWDPHYIRWFRQHHMEQVWVENILTKKKRTFWYRKGHVEVTYPNRLANASYGG